MEEPGGLQSIGLQRVGHDGATEHAYIHTCSIYYLLKMYMKYLNILKGTEATMISIEAISLNFLYLLQMYLLKLLLKIHLDIVVLRQHPVANAGTNPNNPGLLS